MIESRDLGGSSLRRALLITGTVGTGKTATSAALGDLLTELGTPHAVIDVDELRRFWPSPAGDRFNSGIAVRNLRSLAWNYLGAGAVRLVLAGVVETVAERDAYQEALDVPLAVCRLRVELPRVHARLARRHSADELARTWHLDRSTELDRILDDAGVEDFVVATGLDSIPQVATRVMRGAGWDQSRAQKAQGLCTDSNG